MLYKSPLCTSASALDSNILTSHKGPNINSFLYLLRSISFNLSSASLSLPPCPGLTQLKPRPVSVFLFLNN